MTNREYLSSLKDADLLSWLSSAKEERTKSTTDWSYYPNFKPVEFTCACGQCAYSEEDGVRNMDSRLLAILQTVRNKYKRALVITCGARCNEYNDQLAGSIKGSYHTLLKAADFYIAGITATEAGREEVIAFMKLLPGYKYAYHNAAGKYPNMGSAVHIEVK